MAVRRAVGGIAVGGEAAIAGSRLAGWLGRTMARPYIVAGWAKWHRRSVQGGSAAVWAKWHRWSVQGGSAAVWAQ